MRQVAVFTFFAWLATAVAVSPSSPVALDWPLVIEPVPTPAGANSGQPQLTTSSRGTILSWIERSGPQATLKFSERTRSGWTTGRTVATGSDWFVNWADVPSVARLENGTLVAHWLQKSGSDTYAYDVRFSFSTDGGATWQPSVRPHHDGTATEHGFASLFQAPGAGLGLVWLDGRQMKSDHSTGGHGGAGDMTLRFAAFDKSWKQIADQQLDARVCECCPTAVAITTDGPIVAYRDRGPEEIRDIYVTRLERGKWTQPKAVHADNWRVPACPVNGPALSARGRDAAIAWFNAKDDLPKSLAAFSRDSGSTFGAPLRLDDAGSLGRVDIELLDDGAALAAYVEFADQKASFRVRRIDSAGSRSDPVVVAGMVGNRTSGYPRMSRQADEIVFAWVERSGISAQVLTAVATIR